MNKGFYLLISIVLLFVSCEQKDEIQTITVENKFSMMLPSNLTKAEDLASEASLQYQNLRNELYVVVINEPKKELYSVLNSVENSDTLLEKYTLNAKKDIEQKLSNSTFSDTKNIQINGLNAQKFTAIGARNNHEIYYEIAYIEGENEIYQIHVWTKPESKEKYSKQMKEIIASFKEIKSRNAKKSFPN